MVLLPLARIEKRPSLSVRAFAGVASGFVSSLCVYPMDVVITRMQANDGRYSHVPKYRNAYYALRTIARTEGVRSLYVGVVPNLVGSMSSWGLYFVGYSYLRNKACECCPRSNGEQQDLGPLATLACSMTMGCVTAVATQPIWLVNTRLQLQQWSGVHYSGMVHCVRDIVHTEGVRALFRGLVPSLMLVSHVALQFVAYEEIKIRMKRRSGGQPLSSEQTCVAAALSKSAATLATYPTLLVRTRLQQAEPAAAVHSSPPTPCRAAAAAAATGCPRYYEGVMDSWRKIIRLEGVRGLYKGLGTHFVRALPSTAITFCVYEAVVASLV